jgi:FMN phosphatase YigB (HAD superfamily)
MTEPTILWDYDDTLGGVQFPNGTIHPGAEAYFDCIDRFVALMASEGWNAERAKVLQHDIDLELAKTHGFGNKHRFAQSMAHAYLALCKGIGATPSSLIGLRAYDIGMSVFTDYPYVALEGALDVLAETSRYYRPVIVTKGAVDEQMKKLEASGVLGFVDEADVFIVERKCDADWDRVLATVDPDVEMSWTIGNSAKADVNPLLARGFNGIHITAKNNWAFEHAELGEPAAGRAAHVVHDIRDVLDILPITALLR